MLHKTVLVFGVVGLCLGGCGNVPAPDYFVPARTEPAPGTPDSTQVHVDDLVKHIECEFVNSAHMPKLLANPDPKRQAEVPIYVAQVTLTLKVEDNGGLSPSLSFIAPSSFAYGLNGNLNLNRQRTFTTSYFVNLNKLLADPAVTGRCNAVGHSMPTVPSLSGDLGIDGIVVASLATRSHYRDYEKSDKSPSNYPSFGTTVQFLLTASLDTGPSWSLTNFKGPGGSKGLVNGGVIDTDTMLVAFASTNVPAVPAPPPPAKLLSLKSRLQPLLDNLRRGFLKSDDPKLKALQGEVDNAQRDYDDQIARLQADAAAHAAATASDAAQSLTTNMILQNLTGALH